MRKYWIILIVLFILALPLVWYLLSPLFIVIEADEANPYDTTKVAYEEEIEAMKDKNIEMNESMGTAKIIAQGKFVPYAHEVQGKALLIEKDGKKILRFEDFETINGPDLRIYLSAELNNNDYVELSKIKATKGNVNYDVPDTIDLEKYNNVLVWCKPFGVLFSSVTLEEIN